MTSIELIHNKKEEVIMVKINNSFIKGLVWPYGDNKFLPQEYLKEAKIAAFDLAAEYSFNGPVTITETELK